VWTTNYEPALGNLSIYLLFPHVKKTGLPLSTCTRISSIFWVKVLRTVIMYSTGFWDVTPCSAEAHSCFGRTWCLHLQDRTVSQANSSVCLLLAGRIFEAQDKVNSSETSANFYRSTLHQIQEDSTLHTQLVSFLLCERPRFTHRKQKIQL
jgi:hypothetical protein